jgi:membrane associated rhomboid family serine protease
MSRTSNRTFQFAFAGEGLTFAVRALILTNAAIFAAQLLLDVVLGDGNPLNPPGGFSILDTLVYSNDRLMRGWVWTPLTYLFLHAGLWHLFMNMLQLYFFGPEVERLLGTRQFLRFFFVCGVVGALANFVPHALGRPDVPVLGASGAILGVLVAFAVNDPDRHLFLLPLPFPITARAMVLVLVLLNLMQTGGPVSVTTHLGGMFAGFAYMKLRPLTLRWSWERRGRRARRKKRQAESAAPAGTGDEKKLAEAIDHIFKFQDREKR